MKLSLKQSELVAEFNRKAGHGLVEFESVPCLCGSTEFDLIASVDRYSMLQKTVICAKCGLIQSNPRMTGEECAGFYSSDMYRLCYEGEDYLERYEDRYDPRFSRHIFDEIAKVKTIGRTMSVLEIGAGGGWNLTLFVKAGARVTGIDYSKSLVDMGIGRGISMKQGSVDDIEGAYDVIIVNHALEHFPDPVGSLRKIASHLNEDGILYVGVPNIMNFGMGQLQNAHNYYFTPETLGYYSALAGLKAVRMGQAQGIHLFGIFKRSDNVVVPRIAGHRSKMMWLLTREKIKHALRILLLPVMGGRHETASAVKADRVKKIIIIVGTPFSKRDYERYGVDTLKSNGFEVEVWDVSAFIHPMMKEGVDGVTLSGYPGIFIFKTEKEALNRIASLGAGSLVIFQLMYELSSHRLYRSLSKHGIPYCVFNASILPFSAGIGNRSLKDIFGKTGKLLDIGSIARSLFVLLPPGALGIKPASYFLVGGLRSCTRKRLVGPETRTMWMHTLDYDIYLRERQKSVEVDRNLGVFIDEYVPFHPHYSTLRVRPFSTPEEYYPPIRRFFENIEKSGNSRITIAGHPRSQYADHAEYFGGRVVVVGQTMELIRKASFVIGHCSTSLNYAVLEKKPVIFITTDSLQRSMQGEWIAKMAASLGKRVINVDKETEIDIEKEKVVDEDAYDRHKNEFIKKSGTEELPFWQIFANRIKAAA